MTADEQAQVENLTHKVEVLERELGEAHHALAVIERQHFRERIESLEQAGDALADAHESTFGAVADEITAWRALRHLPILSDPDTTPTAA